MASEAQVLANRLNARKSTGPRTAEGKAVVSQNAVKHGLSGREAVIKGEDPGEFEFYRDRLLGELAPAGTVEAMLAERVVGLSWRLQRAERLQNAAFAALDEGEPTPLLDARLEEWKQLKENEWERGLAGVVDEDVALGKVVVADFGGARVLDRLLMYERRIESSLYRTMAQLRQERQARTAAVEAEEVSRSEGDLAAGQEPVAPVELASFGADAVAEGGAEEVSSSQCQVSSGEEASSTKCPVSGGGSDFTLQTSHFKPAMITPDGVTTNEEVGRGRPTYEESSCKTKPMSPASAGGQVPCGEKVMEDSSRNESGKTNPIPGARTACPPSEGRFRCDEVPSQPAVGCLGFPMDGFHPS